MSKHYIVFDLEASCDEAKTIRQEIIEIGAVKINESGETVDTFNYVVKPTLNPILTTYCVDLTKIQQHDIDTADTFPSVIKSFCDWIGNDYILCSWGFYDKKQLKHDCILHHIDSHWVESHISLKHQYQSIKHLKRPVGTRKALSMDGFSFEGTQHRGLDDAQNIAKVFVKNLDMWTFPKK